MKNISIVCYPDDNECAEVLRKQLLNYGFDCDIVLYPGKVQRKRLLILLIYQQEGAGHMFTFDGYFQLLRRKGKLPPHMVVVKNESIHLVKDDIGDVPVVTFKVLPRSYDFSLVKQILE